MPAPTFTPGTIILSSTSVAPGKNVAIFCDFSQIFQGRAWVQSTTPGTSPTAPVVAYTRAAIGAGGSGGTPINPTLTSNVSAGATSIPISSSFIGYFSKGSLIAIISATTKIGEVVAVTSATGSTITTAAITYSYSTGDMVFLVEQTPSGQIANLGSSWPINSSNDCSITPYNSAWVVELANTDSSITMTVQAVVDTVNTIQ